MSRRRDPAALRRRDAVRAQGGERCSSNPPLFPGARRARAAQPSKAELRDQAERALAEFTARRDDHDR